MLHSVKNLHGLQILATDGPIGSLSEFYFDDDRWTIRYLVVDTGSWLPGRQVLISPIAIQSLDRDRNTVSLKITRDQVKNSPDIDTHKPVSRQQEGAHFNYYGYPYYWGGSMLWGPAPYPSAVSARQLAAADAQIQDEQDRAAAQGDDHLRRTKEVVGYHIQAKDGELGHVADFLVDPENWTIRYFVVGTSNWWFGNKVLVAPDWISDVRWIDKKVTVDLTRQSVKDSPPYDETAQFDREWEAGYYAHHQRSPYWSTSETSHRYGSGEQSAAASTLVSLNDSGEFEVADDDQDPRGWEVAIPGGRLIGKVDDLILDTGTMKVRYLDIDLDPQVARNESDRHVLLPVKLAQVGERDERVTVSVDAETLERAPAYRSLPVPSDYDDQFIQPSDRSLGQGAGAYAAAGGWSISARKSTNG